MLSAAAQTSHSDARHSNREPQGVQGPAFSVLRTFVAHHTRLQYGTHHVKAVTSFVRSWLEAQMLHLSSCMKRDGS